MSDITNAKIAMLSTNGFEQSELMHPLRALRNAGADVTVISPEAGQIKGWDNKDWGRSVDVDLVLDQANIDDFDALVLPGGQMNPDILRAIPKRSPLCRTLPRPANPSPPSATRRGC